MLMVFPARIRLILSRKSTYRAIVKLLAVIGYVLVLLFIFGWFLEPSDAALDPDTSPNRVYEDRADRLAASGRPAPTVGDGMIELRRQDVRDAARDPDKAVELGHDALRQAEQEETIKGVRLTE